MLKGWQILWATAIVSVVMLGLIGAIDGLTEASVRVAIRGTARMSCLIFLMAFVAAPLHRLWRTDLSGWLVENRRFLGLSMAVSHVFHGVTLGALHVVTQGQHPQINPLAILGYVFLGLMAVTSFESTAKAIGRRAWRVLHTAGMHYFWLAFMMEFAFRAMSSWIYFVLTILVLAVMVIRLWPRPKMTAMVKN
jgi:methionine sulfoxide reductase heme-binding subunit